MPQQHYDQNGNPVAVSYDAQGNPVPAEADTPKVDTGQWHPRDEINRLGALTHTKPQSSVVEQTKRNLPIIGGLLAGATGGAGLIPIMARQLVGGAAGSAAQDIAYGQPISGLKALGTGAAYGGTAGVLGTLANAKRIGSALWSRVSGEGRPQVIDDVISRRVGGVTPSQIEAVHQEARQPQNFTPAQPEVPPSQTLNASGQPMSPGSPAQPAKFGPLWDTYHSMKNIRENIPSLSGRVAAGTTVGGGIGYLGGGEAASRAGAKFGGIAALLTHPSIGLNAGQAIASTPNVITQGARAMNPSIAGEAGRQAAMDALGYERPQPPEPTAPPIEPARMQSPAGADRNTSGTFGGSSRQDLLRYAETVNQALQKPDLSTDERSYWQAQSQRVHEALQGAR